MLNVAASGKYTPEMWREHFARQEREFQREIAKAHFDDLEKAQLMRHRRERAHEIRLFVFMPLALLALGIGTWLVYNDPSLGITALLVSAVLFFYVMVGAAAMILFTVFWPLLLFGALFFWFF